MSLRSSSLQSQSNKRKGYIEKSKPVKKQKQKQIIEPVIDPSNTNDIEDIETLNTDELKENSFDYVSPLYKTKAKELSYILDTVYYVIPDHIKMESNPDVLASFLKFHDSKLYNRLIDFMKKEDMKENIDMTILIDHMINEYDYNLLAVCTELCLPMSTSYVLSLVNTEFIRRTYKDHDGHTFLMFAMNQAKHENMKEIVYSFMKQVLNNNIMLLHNKSVLNTSTNKHYPYIAKALYYSMPELLTLFIKHGASIDLIESQPHCLFFTMRYSMADTNEKRTCMNILVDQITTDKILQPNLYGQDTIDHLIQKIIDVPENKNTTIIRYTLGIILIRHKLTLSFQQQLLLIQA
jgi:hypothetical protein